MISCLLKIRQAEVVLTSRQGPAAPGKWYLREFAIKRSLELCHTLLPLPSFI